MITTELQATLDNIIETYRVDQIGRRRSVHDFVRFLVALENHCTIALNGDWGTGKTFFVKQTKLILDALNSNTNYLAPENAKAILDVWNKDSEGNSLQNCPVATVYFDAWEHDDEEDPILSLVYDIIKTGIGEDAFKAHDIAAILSSIIDLTTSKNLGSLLKNMTSKDELEKVRKQVGLKEQIRLFFSSLLPEKGNKLVIFIDELDRCSPKYAVKLLERVKHYMNIENIIIVFAINPSELQKSIRHYYGDEFNACRYLDRFFSLRIGMPSIDVSNYIPGQGLASLVNTREKVCLEMINLTKMSMREIAKYLRISKMAACKFTDNNRRNVIAHEGWEYASIFIYHVVVPIAIGLMLTDDLEYKKFVSGQSSLYVEKVLLSGEFDWLVRAGNPQKGNETELVCSKEELARKLYSVVFDDANQDSQYGEVAVGRIVFRQGVRNAVLDAINLVSYHTDLLV